MNKVEGRSSIMCLVQGRHVCCARAPGSGAWTDARLRPDTYYLGGDCEGARLKSLADRGEGALPVGALGTSTTQGNIEY